MPGADASPHKIPNTSAYFCADAEADDSSHTAANDIPNPTADTSSDELPNNVSNTTDACPCGANIAAHKLSNTHPDASADPTAY